MKVFSTSQCLLGESPLWHEDTLYWVDIKGKEILAQSFDEQYPKRYRVPARPSALGISGKESLIVAFDDGIFHFDCISGQREFISKPVEANPKNRANDGKVGPDGRFWFGTMDDEELQKSGALYSWDGRMFQCALEGIGISNTLAWSPCGNFFYFADSMEQIIWRFDFDQESGKLYNKSVFVSLKGSKIYPDGSTIDSEGFLWNAQWDGWRVVRYAPDGNVDQVVELPVQRPTSCIFGGKEKKQLLITSAHIGLSTQERQKQPHAGDVLVINTNVTGVVNHTFMGGR